MKKVALFVVLASSMVATVSAWAGKDDHVIIQEAAKNHVQIIKAQKLADETAVTLTGTITKKITEESFELKDSTASILLDVDDDLSRAINLKVGDQVKVIGEVDTHRHRATDIEVVHIEKMTH
ncbi:DNA-binding protein [Acinetobacter sp. Ac_877]|uniref:NirD/YgiW/YdeI family stress tolerance protein n=1 Tax=Acinetobacter portensis TaxID=1839785 RepID=UPI00128C75B4|nr:NirD/YgiW/YdeI family stress tolerance protein [Acinetobacter portensis]MPW41459.1 DNA-binding protein [Acinetobacter portensis]